jgi:hypothetical protein
LDCHFLTLIFGERAFSSPKFVLWMEYPRGKFDENDDFNATLS